MLLVSRRCCKCEFEYCIPRYLDRDDEEEIAWRAAILLRSLRRSQALLHTSVYLIMPGSATGAITTSSL